MIGSAIRDALLDFQYDLMTNIYFDWLDSVQRDGAFNLIEAACVENQPPMDRVSVVWSAGKSAFHATEDELSRENVPFMDVVDFVSKLKKTLDSARLDIHFVSSAGGLFEGQRVINDKSLNSEL